MKKHDARISGKRHIQTDSLNVLGGTLIPCSFNPLTGFFRDGCCETRIQDKGRHIVRPEFQFEGLKEGDFWCLCIDRWREAMKAGCAPLISLSATHEIALERIPLETLRKHALDI